MGDGIIAADGSPPAACRSHALSLEIRGRDPGRAVSRGPAGPDGQQPHLHHHHGAGALLHGGAGGVHRLSDVRQVAVRLAGLAGAEPDSGRDRPAGAGLPDAVRRQGQPPRRSRPGRPVRHGAGPGADDRPHAQQHLARQAAPAPGAAGDDLLGGHDAGAAAAGRQPEHQFLCASPHPAGLVSAMPGTVQLLLDVLEFFLLTAGLAALYRYVPNTPVRRSHAWAGALFAAIGIEVARRLLAWYIGKMPTYSLVYGTFATRADPAGLDLCRMGHRAAGGGDRRLPAQPDGGHPPPQRGARLAVPAGAGGAARTAPRPASPRPAA